MTRGEGGAFAVAQTGLVEVPAQLVDVLDTVGAGDTFMEVSSMNSYATGSRMLIPGMSCATSPMPSWRRFCVSGHGRPQSRCRGLGQIRRAAPR